jgi:hypothetical protein
MTDIATLGIKIDSGQTVAATSALDKFAAAGKGAATNASALEKAVASASKATTGIGGAASAAVKGTDAIAKSGKLASYELINLGRQAQDIAVSLPNQSIFTVLLQQGSQIFDVFSSSKTATVGGAIKQIGSGIASVITPMRLLVGGITAVSAAGYLIYSSFKQSTLALDDVARAAGTSTGALRALQTVAEFKGIDVTEFQTAMSKFAASVYDAKNNMGGLADVFRANNMSAKDFESSLLNASDLIKRATSDQQRLQLLQQMGLPATMEWVRFLSQGKDAIKAAMNETTKFGESAEQQMIAKARAFDEAWSRVWISFKQGSQSAILSASGWLMQLNDIGVKALATMSGTREFTLGTVLKMGARDGTASKLTATSNVDDFYKGTGAGGSIAANKAPVDPAVLQRQLALQQQYLGLLGQTASAADAVRQVELSVAQARLSGVSIDQKKVEVLKRLASEQSLGITQIKASTDAANIDAATIGMAIGPANAYAAAQNAINEARRAGRTLQPSEIARIQSEASALGQAAQNADNMRFAYENLVRGPMQTFRQSLAQGATFFDALKKAGISALDALSSKLMDMAAQNLWKSAFGGSTGGGLASLFGVGGGSSGELPGFGTPAFVGPTVNHTGYGPGDAPGPTRYVHPAHFNDAPRFHSGIGPGERAAIIRTDESVLTPGQMKAVGSAGGSISAPVYITIDATGADPAGLARVQQQLDTLKAELPSRVVAAVATAKKQRQL